MKVPVLSLVLVLHLPLYGQCVHHDGQGESTDVVQTTAEASVQSALIEINEYKSMHACEPSYTLRPLSQRECSQLTCTYGVCTTVYDGNSLTVGCDCDEGADGVFCEHRCCKPCGEHGNCAINLTGAETCNCISLDYSGENCDVIQTDAQNEEKKGYMWLVGVCAGVLAVLLLTITIFPYYLWKKRVSFVMKVVYYFKPFEDNDDKEWDAFVSYKSGGFDELFVVRKLQPILEGEFGFKLCLHFRDFLAGEAIATNILRAIDGSRRTILLISPSYIESEWTQFEYQIAHELTIRRKHLIIPVMLSDVFPVIDSVEQNLKHIIKTITYLEWPGEENEKKESMFWKKLKLSLPKRKCILHKDAGVLDKERKNPPNIYNIEMDRVNK